MVLDKDRLKLGKQIAQGQFGIVYSALYRSPHGDISVAVKKLKEHTNQDDEAAFRRELGTSRESLDNESSFVIVVPSLPETKPILITLSYRVTTHQLSSQTYFL